MFEFPEPTKPTGLRYSAHGIVSSLVLHGSLLAVLVLVFYTPWWYDAWATREARAIRVAYSTETEKPKETEQEPPPVRIVSDPADVTGEMLKKRLDQVIEKSETLTDEDKLDRLDQLSDRLTQVSSEGSINAMAGALHSLMGSDQRAERPAEEPVPGEFDHDTAQFHEIKRYAKEEGGWRYVAVLLDGDGRTIEVEMSEEDAELAYLTMERIKANPLLSQVYRQMAMPLFDQLLTGMRGVADAAEQLEEVAEDTEPTDGTEQPDEEMENPFADSAAVEEMPPGATSLP